MAGEGAGVQLVREAVAALNRGELRDDRVVATWSYGDPADLVRQLTAAEG